MTNKDKMSRDEHAAFIRLKIVSTTKAVLNGELGIIAGSRDLWRLRYELKDEADPDFTIFVAVDSQTDHLPVDRERENWSVEALKRKDLEIAEVEDRYRSAVMAACRKIIRKFDKTNGI